MGIVLFDWKPARATKKVINSLFSTSCLFDGYLTESTSYPHFQQMVYLTEGCSVRLKTHPNALFSSISLFDDCLAVYPYSAKGGLGKIGQLFGEHTEEIINELNEALAA